VKNLRTEIHITVATYVGDDISEAKPPLSRSPDAAEGCTVVRVSHVGEHTSAPEAGKAHVFALLSNAASVLSEQINHKLRSL